MIFFWISVVPPMIVVISIAGLILARLSMRHAEDTLKVCLGHAELRHSVAAAWHQVSVRPQMRTGGISS
jgi:hypothetical protein